MKMESLPQGYRALVVGGSGGIGRAFVDALRADPQCGHVEALHRHSAVPIDFANEASIEAAAAAFTGQRIDLLINAAGLLHTSDFMPEKRLADLNEAQMLATFRVNAFGPALLIRQFAPLLRRERSVMAMLSAKVGSIGDNRLGGWISYRASKAALNMIVKTAAIELGRSAPNAVLVALHPGTRQHQPVRTVQRRRDRPAAGVGGCADARGAGRAAAAGQRRLHRLRRHTPALVAQRTPSARLIGPLPAYQQPRVVAWARHGAHRALAHRHRKEAKRNRRAKVCSTIDRQTNKG